MSIVTSASGDDGGACNACYGLRVVRFAAVAIGVVLSSWAVLILLAARLPEGSLKELASFLPDCATTARRLHADRRVPRRARIAIALAGLWVLSPIDLIPGFLPVIGPLDDVVVVALAFRYAARQVPPDVLFEAWPGKRPVIERLLRPPPRRHLMGGTLFRSLGAPATFLLPERPRHRSGCRGRRARLLLGSIDGLRRAPLRRLLPNRSAP